MCDEEVKKEECTEIDEKDLENLAGGGVKDLYITWVPDPEDEDPNEDRL